MRDEVTNSDEGLTKGREYYKRLGSAEKAGSVASPCG